MNTLRKLFSLSLALTLLLVSLTVPALAEDTTPKYDISIKGTSDGHNYAAYQLFAGEMIETPQTDADGKQVLGEDGKPVMVAKLGVTSWGDGVNGDNLLAALKGDTTLGGIFTNIDSPQGVATTISTWSRNNPNLLRFSELAASHTVTTRKNAAVQDTTDKTLYKFDDLPAGYYIFVDEAATDIDYYTEVLLEVVQNETIYPKGDIPKLTKQIRPDINDTYQDYASVTSTQYFAFRLEATLPSNYDHYETYKLVFHDDLGDEFILDADEADPKVLIKHATTGSNDLEITNMLVSGDSIDYDKDENEVTLTINDLKTYTTHQSDKIILIFKAKLNPTTMVVGNGNATMKGNVNEAYLEYSNDPNNLQEPATIGTTQKVYAQAFTYSLTVNKVDSVQTTKLLDGAEFLLYRHTEQVAPDVEEPVADSTPETHAENIEYARVDSTGKLIGWTFNKDDATKLVTKDGTFKVSGLTASTYHLKEIKQPAGGYNLLDYDPVVVIKPTFEQNASTKLYSLSGLEYTLNYTDDGTGTVDDGNVTVAIKNSIGSTLPSTGGMGTTLIYAAGGIMVLLAVVLLVTKKRMHNN